MTDLNTVPYLDFFSAALGAEVGIAIQTEDPVLLKNQLYKERSAAGIEAFEQLRLTIPEGKSEVWIFKRGQDA